MTVSKNIRWASVFSVVLMCSACESAEKQIARRAAAAQSAPAAPKVVDGMAVFRKNCTTCHGSDGRLGLNGAKDLTASVKTKEERIALITQGKGLMTPFGKLLTPEEIAAAADYTISLKQ